MINFTGEGKKITQKVLDKFINRAIINDDEILFDDVLFDIELIDCHEDLRGIKFSNCVFKNDIQISNMLNGALISIKNCAFENDIGIVIEKALLNTIEISNNRCVREEESFGGIRPHRNSLKFGDWINFKDVQASNIIINYTNCFIQLDNVSITRRLNLKGVGTTKSGSHVFLENCSVKAELQFNECYISYLLIRECNNLFIGNPEVRPTVVHFPYSNLKDLEINNTICPNLNFYLNIELDNVKIKNSEIGDIQLDMSRIEDDENKAINIIKIVNSVIDDFILMGRDIGNPLNFENTIFKGTPYFFDQVIPQGSVFPGLDNFQMRNGVSTINAYRTLRLSMEEQRAREEEGIFYILENESKLNTFYSKTRYINLIYWYKIFSNYGTSYKRPLSIILISFVVFSICYSLLLSPVLGFSHDFDYVLLEKTTVFSLKQMLLPFYSFRDLGPLDLNNSEAHLVLRFLSAFQSLLSISLFSLTIIAIRWKFKRG